jgi:hypothetical protein
LIFHLIDIVLVVFFLIKLLFEGTKSLPFWEMKKR